MNNDNYIIDPSIEDYHARDQGIYIRPKAEPVAETIDTPQVVLSNPVFGSDFKAMLQQVDTVQQELAVAEKTGTTPTKEEPITPVVIETVATTEPTDEFMDAVEEITPIVADAPLQEPITGTKVIETEETQVVSSQVKTESVDPVLTNAFFTDASIDPDDWRKVPVTNVQRVHSENESKPANVDRLLNYNKERSARVQKTPKAYVPVPRRAALLQSPASVSLVDKFLANRIHNDAEGESHVNIDLDSKFDWARALSLNAHTPFEHPQLGRFNSIGGLWNYLVYDADDNYRTLSGSQVGNYRNSQSNRRENQIEGFLTVMADAVWLKVQTFPALRQALLENLLPFRMYRAEGQSGLRVNNKLVHWYPGVVEEISRALKSIAEGKECAPDFSHLTSLHPHNNDQSRFGKFRKDDRNQGYLNRN